MEGRGGASRHDIPDACVAKFESHPRQSSIQTRYEYKAVLIYLVAGTRYHTVYTRAVKTGRLPIVWG